MKTAIVLGATGLIGKHLVEQLQHHSLFSKVVAVTRRPVDFGSAKVTNAVVNFEQLENHADVFQGDILFSCLGTTKKQAGSIAKQRIVDFDYQLQAAQLAKRNKVAHYLLVSSSGANGKSRSPYLKMKGQLEDEIRQLHFERTSIIQPSLLLGQRDHTRIAETLGSYFLPVLCKLPSLRRFKPIKGSQVATKMVEISLMPPQNKCFFKLDELF
ncbi:NAD(P)H-binding protein [Pseudoalteromonas luteoviolacea]|uniref:NAD(P)H-binding protein n=1 Tax=Pseudoalteromonas luteoviolacea TaxID=43657 RepID=UPI0011514089|nr:NAD(P)H-binding protein [Pseudoalteromonas luteoviolacea]TQF70291.1 NAD-dependent epimerase/dehydratase family protein [Pseudoalteromonas luteoviolacea]